MNDRDSVFPFDFHYLAVRDAIRCADLSFDTRLRDYDSMRIEREERSNFTLTKSIAVSSEIIGWSINTNLSAIMIIKRVLRTYAKFPFHTKSLEKCLLRMHAEY